MITKLKNLILDYILFIRSGIIQMANDLRNPEFRRLLFHGTSNITPMNKENGYNDNSKQPYYTQRRIGDVTDIRIIPNEHDQYTYGISSQIINSPKGSVPRHSICDFPNTVEIINEDGYKNSSTNDNNPPCPIMQVKEFGNTFIVDKSKQPYTQKAENPEEIKKVPHLVKRIIGGSHGQVNPNREERFSVTRKMIDSFIKHSANPTNDSDTSKNYINLPNPIHNLRNFIINKNKVGGISQPTPPINTFGKCKNNRNNQYTFDMVGKPFPKFPYNSILNLLIRHRLFLTILISILSFLTITSYIAFFTEHSLLDVIVGIAIYILLSINTAYVIYQYQCHQRIDTTKIASPENPAIPTDQCIRSTNTTIAKNKSSWGRYFIGNLIRRLCHKLLSQSTKNEPNQVSTDRRQMHQTQGEPK